MDNLSMSSNHMADKDPNKIKATHRIHTVELAEAVEEATLTINSHSTQVNPLKQLNFL